MSWEEEMDEAFEEAREDLGFPPIYDWEKEPGIERAAVDMSAVRGKVMVNPEFAPQLSPKAKKALFSHELGHHTKHPRDAMTAILENHWGKEYNNSDTLVNLFDDLVDNISLIMQGRDSQAEELEALYREISDNQHWVDDVITRRYEEVSDIRHGTEGEFDYGSTVQDPEGEEEELLKVLQSIDFRRNEIMEDHEFYFHMFASALDTHLDDRQQPGHGQGGGQGQQQGDDQEQQHGDDQGQQQGDDQEQQHGDDQGQQQGDDQGQQHGDDQGQQHGDDRGQQQGDDQGQQHGDDRGQQQGDDQGQQHGDGQGQQQQGGSGGRGDEYGEEQPSGMGRDAGVGSFSEDEINDAIEEIARDEDIDVDEFEKILDDTAEEVGEDAGDQLNQKMNQAIATYYDSLSRQYNLKIKGSVANRVGTAPDGHKDWEIGDRSDMIDPENSLGKIGMPGVTKTRKRKGHKMHGGQAEGKPDATVIIDSSNSMQDPERETSYAVLGAFCAANSYLGNGSEVAVANFSSETLTTEFTNDKEEVQEALVEYQDGGTNLDVEAVEELEGNKPEETHSILITDAQIKNFDEAVEYLENSHGTNTVLWINNENEEPTEEYRELEKASQTTLYNIQDESDIPEIVLGEI